MVHLWLIRIIFLDSCIGSSYGLSLSAAGPGFPIQLFVHQDHHQQDDQQKKRKQGNADIIGSQAEQRRHDTCSHISGGHLDTDYGL